jgi:hypothetical protein
MKAKEKAKELFYCFTKCKDKSNSYYVTPIIEDAKQCALIAVDEIINSWDSDLYKDCGSSIYWQEVKQEINKL